MVLEPEGGYCPCEGLFVRAYLCCNQRGMTTPHHKKDANQVTMKDATFTSFFQPNTPTESQPKKGSGIGEDLIWI